MFWMKLHKQGIDTLIAVCDEEILGKKIKIEKDFEIEIKEEFYKGKLVDEETVIKFLKKATIANLFGNKVVELALKNNFIEKENIIKIKGISHAQIIEL